MPFEFDVVIKNVRGEGIISGHRTPALYLKVDFDHYKTFDTEVVKGTTNPEWNVAFPPDEGLLFRYSTNPKHIRIMSNPTVKDQTDLTVWMSKKTFSLAVYHNKFMTKDDFIGSTQIDLMTLATGPEQYTLQVRACVPVCTYVIAGLISTLCSSRAIRLRR